MTVQTFGLFHGVVLTKLVRNERPVTLRMIETNRAEAWALYTINLDVTLLIKYVTTHRLLRRNEGRSWQFVFSGAEIGTVRHLFDSKQVFAALVCGAPSLEARKMAVCLLKPADVERLLDLEDDTAQSVTVRRVPGRSLRAQTTRAGEIVVPRNRLDKWMVPGS